MRVFTRSSRRKEAHVQCGMGTTLCQGPSCLVSTLQGATAGIAVPVQTLANQELGVATGRPSKSRNVLVANFVANFIDRSNSGFDNVCDKVSDEGLSTGGDSIRAGLPATPALFLVTDAQARTPNACRRGERGSAVLVVLILAMIMAALIADNGLVLHRLKQEIKLIEKKQAKKYQQPPHHAPARGARTALSAQTPVSELADMAVRAPAGRPVAQEADAHTSVSVALQLKPDKAP